MSRHSEEKIVESKKLFNGAGEAEMHKILNGADEMYGKGRVFNHLVLHPGCEIGWHVHKGDGETYYILKGRGLYNDNGTELEVGPGDVTFTDSGEGHALLNNGEEDLEAIALATSGAVGSEMFDGFELLDRERAQEIFRTGRDEHGRFYSLATWMVLSIFLTRF